jgi:uncharacterized protein
MINITSPKILKIFPAQQWLALINNIHEKIANIDWQTLTGEINEKGHALVLRFLDSQSCNDIISKYNDSDLYRKTIIMERHRFGLGEYKYFRYPLPDLIQTVRTGIYPKLAPIANAWTKMLNIQTLSRHV